MAAPAPTRRLKRPAIFLCDMQEKFRPAIWEFDKITTTCLKLLRASTILKIPIFATTQNASRLGAIVPALASHLSTHSSLTTLIEDKTLFSMFTPAIAAHFPPAATPSEIAIIGIESHICVTQTALDLLAAGHKVYVIADGVSSCNKEEVPIALARLRAEGAVVTTSESWMYEAMGDAGIEEFKSMAKLVKETSGETTGVLNGVLARI